MIKKFKEEWQLGSPVSLWRCKWSFSSQGHLRSLSLSECHQPLVPLSKIILFHEPLSNWMALPSQRNLNEVIQWLVKKWLIPFIKKEWIDIYLKNPWYARFSFPMENRPENSPCTSSGKVFYTQIFVLTSEIVASDTLTLTFQALCDVGTCPLARKAWIGLDKRKKKHRGEGKNTNRSHQLSWLLCSLKLH